MKADEILAGYDWVRDARGRVLIVLTYAGSGFWRAFPTTRSGARALGGATEEGAGWVAFAAARYAVHGPVYPGDAQTAAQLRAELRAREPSVSALIVRALSEATHGDLTFLEEGASEP